MNIFSRCELNQQVLKVIAMFYDIQKQAGNDNYAEVLYSRYMQLLHDLRLGLDTDNAE